MLLKTKGEHDAVARMGGDEFTVLLPYQNARAAKHYPTSLREIIAVENFYPANALLNFSVGAATDCEGMDVNAIYCLADIRPDEDKRLCYAKNERDRRADA